MAQRPRSGTVTEAELAIFCRQIGAMLTLGVISLGIAGLWWASLSGALPAEQFGPNIALWVGSCTLVSALIFRKFRPVRIAHCSFCRQPESEAGALVQGPGVAICQACM